jgi:phosphoglycerate dehydrogenase-like enzyme
MKVTYNPLSIEKLYILLYNSFISRKRKTDNIDSVAAGKHGILVSNVPGGNANGVAELTIGMMLDVYRKISLLNKETKSGQWSMWKYRSCSYELNGKVHGIIGFGNRIH